MALARLTSEAVGILTATANRSFDFAQDDGISMLSAIGLVVGSRWSVVGTRVAASSVCLLP